MCPSRTLPLFEHVHPEAAASHILRAIISEYFVHKYFTEINNSHSRGQQAGRQQSSHRIVRIVGYMRTLIRGVKDRDFVADGLKRALFTRLQYLAVYIASSLSVQLSLCGGYLVLSQAEEWGR